MKQFFTLISVFLVGLAFIQTSEAQSVARSDKAVFYNFLVKKCTDCAKPYSAELQNVNSIRGSFKGVNPNLKPQLHETSFLITAYDKRTGEKLFETVASNPVDINVEYDGEGHSHQGDPGLTRKTISLAEAQLAVRMPFDPSECSIHIAYIERADKIISIATF